MAVEKGKVLVAIESKFKGKSISKTYKDSLATKWAAKIETDDDIDSFIDDRSDDVIEASKEHDRRVTEAVKTAKQEAADLLAGKQPEKKDEQISVSDDAPEWAKALLKQNETLSQEILSIKSAKSAETLAERFKKDERLKGVPEFILSKSLPKSEEDFETAVTALQTEFTQFATENKLSVLGKDTPAGGASSQTSGKVDSDLVAFAQKKEAASQSKN